MPDSPSSSVPDKKADTARFHLYPVMSEGLGVFRLSDNTHKHVRSLCENVIDEASEGQKRTGPAKNLFHVCNVKEQNIFKEFPSLAPLKQIILNFAQQYVRSLGFHCEKFILTDAWLNVGGEGSALPYHVHTNSFISGTYFVRLNPKFHSQLRFKNDRAMNQVNRAPSMTLMPLEGELTPYNVKEIIIGEEGDIVFWRSNLFHGYDAPNRKGGRVSLSFNLMPVECTDGQIYSFRVCDDG